MKKAKKRAVKRGRYARGKKAAKRVKKTARAGRKVAKKVAKRTKKVGVAKKSRKTAARRKVAPRRPPPELIIEVAPEVRPDRSRARRGGRIV